MSRRVSLESCNEFSTSEGSSCKSTLYTLEDQVQGSNQTWDKEKGASGICLKEWCVYIL